MNKVINEIILKAQDEILNRTGKHVLLQVATNASIPGMKELCEKICKVWGVEYNWLSNGRRSEGRPIMKKIIWMILRKNFPKTPMIYLANIMGHKDHAGVIHGLWQAEIWLAHNDEKFMSYYEPVKHFFNEPEPELENENA